MSTAKTEEPEETKAAKPGVFAVVTLDTPLKRGEQTIGIIELRKPNSGELRGLSMVDLVKLEIDALSKLLPRITNPRLIEAEVHQLDPSDMFQLATEVAGFLLPKGMKPDSLAS